MNLAEIRDGLKERLRVAIQDVKCYDTSPDKPELPAAVVVPGDPYVIYNSAFARGLTDIRLNVTILVSTSGSDSVWQDRLDAFCSAGAGANQSVVDAIEEERTLGGTVNDAFVIQSTRYGTLPATDDYPFRLGTVTLEVLAHVPRT